MNMLFDTLPEHGIPHSGHDRYSEIWAMVRVDGSLALCWLGLRIDVLAIDDWRWLREICEDRYAPFDN
jgi:hypothetical protein